MYSWTPSPPANLHHPHQMSLGFQLHSIFWIICLQNKGAQWLDLDWLLLTVFPLGRFAHHLSTFGHLTSLCTECCALFLHLQTTFFWLLPCLVCLARKTACLCQQVFAVFRQSPSRPKTILGLRSGLPSSSAQSRKSVITSYVLQFQMTIIQSTPKGRSLSRNSIKLARRVNWEMKMTKITL